MLRRKNTALLSVYIKLVIIHSQSGNVIEELISISYQVSVVFVTTSIALGDIGCFCTKTGID